MVTGGWAAIDLEDEVEGEQKQGKTCSSNFATFASTITANDADHSLVLLGRSLTLRATSFPSLPTTALYPVLRGKASTLM